LFTRSLQTLKSSQDEATEIMEHIHEILAAVIVVYETTKIDGALSPAILSEIAKFVEYVAVGSYFRHNSSYKFQNPSQNTHTF
jgi:hypothetical protein